MRRRLVFKALTAVLISLAALGAAPASAWDHPGHMISAAIAYEEIKQARPDLIEKMGLLFLAHPDTAPFWVAAGEAKGEERVRRMFMECARWPDDSKFTPRDQLTWHSARWPVVSKDAPPEAIAAAEARHGKPVGQALEAVALNYGTLSNSESSPSERAFALCWVMHIVGDLHQPMHVSDLFSKSFPMGNPAGSLGFVMDPVSKTPITLHILWDSNALRVPSLEEVDNHKTEFLEKYPRSAFPELEDHPVGDSNAFEAWARESNQVALDWAFDVDMIADSNKDQTPQEVVQGMVNFILNGVSPVDDAPDLPDGYWEKLQPTAEQRITLAGYRLADLLVSAADQIEAQRTYVDR